MHVIGSILGVLGKVNRGVETNFAKPTLAIVIRQTLAKTDFGLNRLLFKFF